jgi:hypothetical protein
MEGPVPGNGGAVLQLSAWCPELAEPQGESSTSTMEPLPSFTETGSVTSAMSPSGSPKHYEMF